MVHVWPEFAFSGTRQRVPAMVRILMAHVGREFAGSRAFLPHVYRRGVPPVHMRGELAGLPRTGGRRVPRGRLPVPVCPEFRATAQTRPRCVPAPGAARTRGARVYAGPASSRQVCTGAHRQRTRGSRVCAGPANSARVCTRGPAPPARTRTDLAESCELGPGVLHLWGRRGRNPGVCDAVMVKRVMVRPTYLRSCVVEPNAHVSHPGDSRITRSTPATSWHGTPLYATHRGRPCGFAQTGAGCVRRRVRARHDLAGSCELGSGVCPRPSRPCTHQG